jgi:hypothetical protein
MRGWKFAGMMILKQFIGAASFLLGSTALFENMS